MQDDRVGETAQEDPGSRTRCEEPLPEPSIVHAHSGTCIDPASGGESAPLFFCKPQAGSVLQIWIMGWRDAAREAPQYVMMPPLQRHGHVLDGRRRGLRRGVGDSGRDALTYLGLGLGRAGPARLELAVRTLVDEVMRARMAHVAVPLDEGGVGLDEFEGMRARVWLGHGGRCSGTDGAGMWVGRRACM